jgi:hypothetical protein
MQAIGNNPSLDNSASVCRPRSIGDDKDILANWDAHDASIYLMILVMRYFQAQQPSPM